MKALWLTLILCFSCTKYSTVDRESGSLEVSDINMDVSRLEEVEWYVGKRKEKTLTQSVTFVIDMPKVKMEDLDYLTEIRGVDAWIIRVIAVRGSEQQDLGSLFSQFRPRRQSRSSSGSPASTVSVKIYYAAAYASERLRNSRCPSFGHDKKISSMEVDGEDTPFSLSIGHGTPYAEKSQLIELTPSSFNAGNTLVANYFLEIAAYDSRRKQILSSFQRLPKYISIKAEEKVFIESCLGSSIQN